LSPPLNHRTTDPPRGVGKPDTPLRITEDLVTRCTRLLQLLAHVRRKVDNAYERKHKKDHDRYVQQYRTIEKDLDDTEALLRSHGVDPEQEEGPNPQSAPNTPKTPTRSLPPVDFSTPRQSTIKEETEDEEEPSQIQIAHQNTPIVHRTPSTKRTISTVNMPATSISATTTAATPHDKELRLNTPPRFKGDRTKLRKFIQDCKIYLAINKQIYVDDEAKCAFMLSYMEGGEADAWKEQYISSLTNPTTGIITFETTDELIKKLLVSFNESQQQENALHRLTQLRQGKGTVEEHNIKFNLVRDQAKLNDNNDHMLIDVYKKSINPSIARKIIEVLDKPKDLKEWMDKAAAYDNHWRQANDYLRVGNPGRNMNQ